MHIWSERPLMRVGEVLADVATLVWLTFWVTLGVRLYGLLANLAESGRLVRDGGARITGAGESIGSALEDVPLVGQGAADGIRGAFAAAGDPIVAFGSDLERLLIIVAVLLGTLLVAIAVVPWLNRYLPWRVARWRRLNAAARRSRWRRSSRCSPRAPFIASSTTSSSSFRRTHSVTGSPAVTTASPWPSSTAWGCGA
jgi:hypothetical protein